MIKNLSHNNFIRFAIIIMLLPCMVFALPDDQKQVLKLRADTVDISQKKNSGMFFGNVELDQGSTHVRAAVAQIKTNEKNQIILAIARGSDMIQAHYWTLPEATKPELHAYADNIYYYPETRIIKLIGNSYVQQGKNSFKAPVILFNIEDQNIVTEQTGKQRTTIVIQQDEINGLTELRNL